MTGSDTHGLAKTVRQNASGSTCFVCLCGWQSFWFYGHHKKRQLEAVEQLRQHVISTWKQ